MSEMSSISFKVTPSQKSTIDSRVIENGFDDISSYVKVVALKTQPFTFAPIGTDEEETIDIEFKVTAYQKEKIEENVKNSDSKSLVSYLQYVALHGVVTAIVEVRSTGNLDDMLSRIAKSRSNPNLKKLF